MKKMYLFVLLCFLFSSVSAQWVLVNNGLGDHPPTTMCAFADNSVVLGTSGGGIFKTSDNGASWSAINGDIGSLNINVIAGFVSNESMFVGTAEGPYLTMDQSVYEDCTSTGLTNTDIRYFWLGEEELGGDFMIGTNGDGLFGSEEYNGPWTQANTGLSGDALFVNDMGGYSDGSVDFGVLATENGPYFADMTASAEWFQAATGLSGDALSVKKLTGLGSMIYIATRAGLYWTIDMGASWITAIPDIAFNTAFIKQSPESSSGFFLFAFGESGYYSENFKVFTEMDMGGLPPGEITAAIANETDLFIGITTSDDGNKGGGIYRLPLGQVIVGIDNPAKESVAILSQNSPNPVSGNTTIKYQLNRNGHVKIVLVNIMGQIVDRIENVYQQEGYYSFDYSPDSRLSGVYFYQILVDDKIVGTKKISIL